MLNRAQAIRANERGRELAARGEVDRAAESYRRAMAIDPHWSVPHYNLGLLQKYAGDWSSSLASNQRAVELNSSDEGAWWNLAIAATALGDWAEARRAWRACGIEVPAGSGPIDCPSGTTPIRLHPHGSAEVVWARRLDPARAKLESIPFPDSGFRWGDVVLNDGAPNGYRMLGDREVPVFDCLCLLEASRFSTYVAEVDISGEEPDGDALTGLAAERGMAAEDWSRNVRLLCKACSEGRPHAAHDQDLPRTDGLHRVGVAALRRSDADALLSAWLDGVPSARLRSLDLGLGG
jgi:hypothetical protein